MKKYVRGSINSGRRVRQQPLWKRIIKNKIFLLSVLGALVLTAIILIMVAAGQGGQDTAQLDGQKEEITIAICDYENSFCRLNTQTGEYEGFEIDFISSLVQRIYGEEIFIEFVPHTSQTASAAVVREEADLAVAMLPSNISKTQGFVITDPYYQDEIAVLVRQDSPIESLADLDGKNVGVLYTMMSETIVEDYVKDNNLNTTLIMLASLEDCANELANGTLDAVVGPKQHLMLASYENGRYLSDSLGNIGYRVVLNPDTSGGTESIYNSEIEQMLNDGTIQTLTNKWNLDYLF